MRFDEELLGLGKRLALELRGEALDYYRWRQRSHYRRWLGDYYYWRLRDHYRRRLGRTFCATQRDPPDIVAGELSEPEVAVGAGRDPERAAVRGGDWELGNCATRGDPSDTIPFFELGEPQI